METQDRGISRRKLLKSAGVVGAVAWAVPALTSFETPAFASTANKSCASIPFQQAGGSCAQCSGSSLGCGGDSSCACHINVKGCCFCGANASCSALPTCTTSKTCPKGWQCVLTCCSTTQLYCQPPCGFKGAMPAKKGERTANAAR